MPELVPAAELPNAIGLSSAIFQVARILGPALGGVLIVAVGTGVCFVLNAVSFVFIIAALLMMRTSELHRGAPVARDKGQIRDGLRYVWRTPELRSTLLLTLVVGTFAINSPVVLPLLAKITFDGNAEVYSWMTIAMGAGALVGALVVANRAQARGDVLLITGFGFGVAICVAAMSPSLPIFLGMLVLVGAGQISFLATCNSLIQLSSDPAMRGRVMSVYMITLLGSTPIGGPLIGWISEQCGPRWGFGIGGIATILAVALLRHRVRPRPPVPARRVSARSRARHRGRGHRGTRELTRRARRWPELRQMGRGQVGQTAGLQLGHRRHRVGVAEQ